MLPSLSGLSLQVPHVPIDALGKRKLSDTDPIELVRALVEAALLWTTHKARAHRQIHKSTMRHTVVEKEQGGFEVDVHFRKESSTASTTNHVKIDLPAPFEAPRAPLIQTVTQDTYNRLEQAVWDHLTGKHVSPFEDEESFGPELTDLIETALKDGPWGGCEIQKPRIRVHGDASTKTPLWHNDASNPRSEEIVTFYVRSGKGHAPLSAERMPRIVQGPVPWVDMEQIAESVLRALGFDFSSMDFNGGPLPSLKSKYDRYIRDGINSKHFEVVPWPENAFVRVSGTFHAGPAPGRWNQSNPDVRKGRIILAFRTGRTVADSMNAAHLG